MKSADFDIADPVLTQCSTTFNISSQKMVLKQLQKLFFTVVLSLEM